MVPHLLANVAWETVALGVMFGIAVALLFIQNRKDSKPDAKVAQQKLDELEAERVRLERELALAHQRVEDRDSRIAELREVLAKDEVTTNELRQELSRLSNQLSETEARRQSEAKAAEDKLKLLDEAQVKLRDAFGALSAEALSRSSKQFLELAKGEFEKHRQAAAGDLEQRKTAIGHLVTPLKESLAKVDEKLQGLEKARTEAYVGLTEQIKHMAESQARLQSETGNLVKALRSPNVRGRWGEMQLKRSVELAGMVNHVDFFEQEHVDVEGIGLRPDMVIHLPNGRRVVVDSKAPLAAYLEGLEAESAEAQQAAMAKHARQIRDHLKMLGSKQYWKQFEPTPEFVVLFLPGETFFGAALEQDPELVDFGVEQRCILATPTTLIALLKAVSYGWRQEEIAKEAKAICELGQQVYDRMGTMAEHFGAIGKQLEKATESYNKAVASVESRVLPAARKFENFASIVAKDFPELKEAEARPRALYAEELQIDSPEQHKEDDE